MSSVHCVWDDITVSSTFETLSSADCRVFHSLWEKRSENKYKNTNNEYKNHKINKVISVEAAPGADVCEFVTFTVCEAITIKNKSTELKTTANNKIV